MAKPTKAIASKSGSSLPEVISVELEPSKYDAALKYLFDRPEPASAFDDAWYWDYEEEYLALEPIDWVRFQSTLFRRCGVDLSQFSDKQVGMGLHFLMDGGLSDASMSVVQPGVPKSEALAMMQSFPTLWSDCIGPRLREVRAPIGTCAHGRLGYVCYMWFDVWPVPYLTSTDATWNAATWTALRKMLEIDVREVQIAALHGIGHCAVERGFDDEIDEVISNFVRGLNGADPELANYALAAQRGRVQ